jgi:1-acyl-sn-glycerol-3-phosphate acyltransferase
MWSKSYELQVATLRSPDDGSGREASTGAGYTSSPGTLSRAQFAPAPVLTDVNALSVPFPVTSANRWPRECFVRACQQQACLHADSRQPITFEMLSFLPPFARGAIAASLLGLNTLFWCAVLVPLALVKLAGPTRAMRAPIDRALNGLATLWVVCNTGWMRLTQSTKWDVSGLEELECRAWYMVNSNHQSWVDILVLQHLLNGRVPMLKFFLKRQLIYVPVIGLAWWALDFPFMRRHSATYLEAHPEKRLEDIETTRRACQKFALVPTSVVNFPEGTRFTHAKHGAQHSPYHHLLKPKSGALALALAMLGAKFDSLLDVTIVYPDRAPTFWQFLCGNVPRIVVRVRKLPIPRGLRVGDYSADPKFRQAFQQWLQDLWHEKDEQIGAVLVREPAHVSL